LVAQTVRGDFRGAGVRGQPMPCIRIWPIRDWPIQRFWSSAIRSCWRRLRFGASPVGQGATAGRRWIERGDGQIEVLGSTA